jgi:hypothetical protein
MGDSGTMTQCHNTVSDVQAFFGLSSRASLDMIKQAFQHRFKGANRHEVFEILAKWLGLSYVRTNPVPVHAPPWPRRWGEMCLLT